MTGVQLQIRLHGSQLGADMLDGEEPEVLRIDLPVPGNSKKVSDTFVRDLTSHPWAGMKVRVILFATDALGQKGSSTAETFLLPERVFNDPTARALIVLRKQLTIDPKALRLDAWSWQDIEVVEGPAIVLHGRLAELGVQVDVSLTHSRDTAGAVAVVR